ncbi:hypothetical protein BVRB_008260 [Beta vulgaris subsp. vulgaris]|uniref:Uncharacterized protein n=1 Tax=Beta vulgaris subsp. vulgaris TaxID=3555 RepID=A0A0J8B357_BETVV|nr:hypothetical protein BVRB_008260 [Beta vulgaris subsp. vulgaris]
MLHKHHLPATSAQALTILCPATHTLHSPGRPQGQ